MNNHIHEYRKGRGSVDVCSCGRFRHNEKAGPAIVEQREPGSEIAVKVARRVFEKRGNHSEVHLSEAELGALIIVGIREFKKSEVK